MKNRLPEPYPEETVFYKYHGTDELIINRRDGSWVWDENRWRPTVLLPSDERVEQHTLTEDELCRIYIFLLQ